MLLYFNSLLNCLADFLSTFTSLLVSHSNSTPLLCSETLHYSQKVISILPKNSIEIFYLLV